jgi:hypothetical protein
MIGVAACGGGGKKTTASAPTTAAPTATTFKQGGSSSKSGGGSGSCPSIGPVPSGAGNASTAKMDLDGNGVTDTLRVYLLGNDWHARGEIGGAGFDDETIYGSGPMEAFGGAKVNADAAQEAWIKVGQGGSGGDIITFFAYGQCKLRQVRLNGSPANFSIGMGPTHADGLSCFGSGTGLTIVDTTSNDGITYSGTSKLYTLSVGPPPSLVPASTASESESNPPGGPAFDALSSFHCGGLSLP